MVTNQNISTVATVVKTRNKNAVLLAFSVVVITSLVSVFTALAAIVVMQSGVSKGAQPFQISATCQSDKDCRGNEFCLFTGCPSDTTFQTGVCTRVPNFCTKQYDPVCGCDGQTYSNSCSATAVKKNVACPGACPCPTPKVYQGNDLKINDRNLTASFGSVIILERIAASGETPTSTVIYTLDQNKLVYQSTINDFVKYIISFNKAADGVTEWLAVTVRSNIWMAPSLKGSWQRDYQREKSLCYQGRPCEPEQGVAERAIIESFAKDNFDDSFVAVGIAGCQPNASLDRMVTWSKTFLEQSNYAVETAPALNYLYYGGECPLDDAFAARVSLTRKSSEITEINFDRSENLWSTEEEQKMSNRRVGAILTQDNYVIYSGEGWIGKAPQLNPQGNWKFPVWHNTQEEYLYPLGILKIDDLIIVYGYDKANISAREAVQLKISNTDGESFVPAEPNLRSYLGDLLPTAAYTRIVHMEYDAVDGIIYFVINDGLKKNDLLFSLPYGEIQSWL